MESSFLLDSLRVSLSGNPGSLDLGAAARLNSDRLVVAAHFHRVTPLAYQTFSKLDPEHFPASILHDFGREVKQIVLQSLRLTAEMLRLLSLLEDQEIPAVAFKGPALSMQAHGDPFLRQCDDIDLLVHPADFEGSRSLLLLQGYADQGEVAHAVNLFHPKLRAAVDLHRWIPGPVGFAGLAPSVIDAQGLLGRAAYQELQEHRIRTFQAEDLLLVLCVHAAKHAWHRWIWLFDIAALIARNPSLDWDLVAQRARELSILEPVYLSLRLTETLCCRSLPPGVLKAFRVRPEIEELVPPLHSSIVQDPNSLRSSLRLYLLPFQTLTTSSDKGVYLFRILRKQIRPNRADHELLPLPRSLRFLYLLIRPLRLLYAHGTNVADYIMMKMRRSNR